MSGNQQVNRTSKSSAPSLTEQAKEAFGRINAACPEDGKILGQYLAAINQKNVIALGEGEAFVLTDAEGRSIKATKRTVRLSAENGGLMQPVYNGPYAISAPGYSMLAHAAGAVVMNAPTVIVDGVEQQNPYVRRAPDGGIVEVHCRAMAFRYNENGQPMVSDRTTIFDTATYTLADMVAKAKKAKDAFRLLPSQIPAPAPAEEWACYPVDGAVNLWMRITHDEVINFLGQVLNRKKKAMEFSQTFAQRNALKHLFGISVVPGQGSGNAFKPISQWDVPVVCWSPSDGGLVRFDTARYAASTQVIEALTSGKPVALPEAKTSIVISRGTDEVHGSDIDEEPDPLENPDRYDRQGASSLAAPIPEEAPVILPAAPEPVTDLPPRETSSDGHAEEQDWTEEERRDWRNLAVAKDNFPDEYAAALSKCRLKAGEENPGNAAAINQAISSMIDGQ